MKKTTLISIIDTLFTNETGFFAVWIDAEKNRFVTINALWMFFDLARHFDCEKIQNVRGQKDIKKVYEVYEKIL